MNRDRGCTDIPFLLIWFAFLASLGYLTNLGFKEGSVTKLLAPIDGQKSFCGWKNESRPADLGGPYDYTDYPKLLITDWGTINPLNIFDSGVCVRECPTGKDGFVLDCKTTDAVKDCNSDDLKKEFIEMVDILNLCVPTTVPEEAKPTFDAVIAQATSAGGGVFNDLSAASKAIKTSIVLGFVYSLAFIYLMSWFAETLAWICVILVQLTLIGGTAALYLLYDAELQAYAALPDQFDGAALEKKNEESETTQLYIMIGLGTVGLLCLAFCCCIACNFDSLKKAIDVIDAAADFLAGTKRIILVPAVFFTCSLIAVSVWMGAMAAVLSLNDIYPSEYIPQGRELDWKDDVRYMALYMLFGILWITAFFEYCSTFVVMVSASSYYFNSNPEEEGSAEVAAGFKYAFLHQGSIAIGAFIIALIRFIRIVFMYLARKLEKQSGENPVVKAVVRCAECILMLIEKICDYINSSAYAYQAVSGESFCTSAWNAFLLQIKHLAKFSFANFIAKIFMFMGKVAITGGNIVSCYYVMKKCGNLE